MRIPFALWLIATLVLLVAQRDVPAQSTSSRVRTHGMFGDRELGDVIKLQPSTRFSNTFWRGPSGNFLGRDANAPSRLFPSVHRDPTSTVQQYQAVLPPGASSEIGPFFPRELPAAAQIEESPQLEEAPQIWFRGSSPPGEATAAPLRSPLPPAAGPGIALGGGRLGATATGSDRGAPRLATGMAIGFPQPGPVDQFLSSALSSQISKIPRYQSGEPITVTVSRGTATLRGTVPTQHDRKVLAEFVRMEPGVWKVDNRLTVQP